MEPSHIRSLAADDIPAAITFDRGAPHEVLVRALRLHGIVRVPGFFATGCVQGLEAEMQEVFASTADWITHYRCSDPDSHWPAGHIANVMSAEAAAADRLPLARAAMDPKRMRRIVEACAGRCGDDAVPIIKYSHEWIPGERNIPLHYDWVRAVKWFCFLSPVDEDNGAIVVRLGSHRPMISLAQALLAQGFEVRELPAHAEILREEPPSAAHPDGLTELVLAGGERKPRIHLAIDEYFPAVPMSGEPGDLYLFDGAILHLGGMLAREGCRRKLVRGHGRTLRHWGDRAPEAHGRIRVLASTRPIAPRHGIATAAS